MENIRINGIYQHYKGNRYLLVGIANHSETLEKLVIYKALYGEGELWARPLDIFLENVEIDGVKIPRFKLLEE